MYMLENLTYTQKQFMQVLHRTYFIIHRRCGMLHSKVANNTLQRCATSYNGYIKANVAHIHATYLQLHSIQILRLGDIEVDLDTVAAGQGHGFDEMGGDELALCGGGGIEHLGPGQKLLVLFL